MNEELRKELKDLGSSIEPGSKKESYEVPEGYFASMQDDVLKTLDKEGKRKGITRRLRTWIYASAAVVVLLIGSIIVFNTQQGKAPGFEQLDSEAVYAYLDENLEDISWQMLVKDAEIKESVASEKDETDIFEKYLEENLDDLSIEELENLL